MKMERERERKGKNLHMTQEHGAWGIKRSNKALAKCHWFRNATSKFANGVKISTNISE